MQEKNGTGRAWNEEREVWKHMNPHLWESERIKLAVDIFMGWCVFTDSSNPKSVEWAFNRADMVPSARAANETVVYARSDSGWKCGWKNSHGRVRWFGPDYYPTIADKFEGALQVRSLFSLFS